MTNKRNFLVTAAAFLVLFSLCNGQSDFRVADVDKRRIDSQEGEEVSILCRFSSPIQICSFKIPGEDAVIKLSSRWPSRNPNFEYVGNGVENGQCGIKILRMRDTYHGNASCFLDPDDGLREAVGNFEIVIARAPSLPEIRIFNEEKLTPGDKLTAMCTVQDGRPAAEIKWFINDAPLGAGLTTITDSNANNTTFYTTESQIQHAVRPEDNLRNLICRAYHPAFANDKGYSETTRQLEVFYKPLAMKDIVIGSLEIGKTVVVGPITLTSNPRPNIRWVIDGETVRQGQSNQRFIVTEPIQTDVNRWNATLKIVELTLQDFSRSFKLIAENKFGETDYKVRITASDDVNGSGLGTVSIVAIAIISVFVLVIVALLVVARVTKRWCFAGDSMHPNSPDSEAQIAPDEDKSHEHYEQQKVEEESEQQEENGNIKASNGNGTKNNTSV